MKRQKQCVVMGIFILALCIALAGCTDNGNGGNNGPVKVSSISFPEKELWLAVDETAVLTPVISPPDAVNKYVSWISSDDDTVSVDYDGLVTALKLGEAVITVVSQDNFDVEDTMIIKVQNFDIVDLTNITIENGDISLVAGNEVNLSITLTPEADTRNVLWSSNKPSIATVSPSGQVTGVTAGTAKITVKSRLNPAVSASITATVTAPSGSMTPEEIFDSLKGKKITTNGWADLYNDAGLYYANPADFILIDDAAYPAALQKRTAFTNAILTQEEKFIILSGNIDLSDGKISDNNHAYFDEFDPVTHRALHGDIKFQVGSNTTIIGINNAKIMFGGLEIGGGSAPNNGQKQNIIIRNVTFWDAHGSTAYDTKSPGNSESKAGATGLQIHDNGVLGLWVDHCMFTDGTCIDLSRNYNHDGAFDIKKGKFITVSWCDFTNHDKVMLVGSGDNATYFSATDRQITLHHNFFHGTTQRMPRTRGTQMHVYNNYYNEIGNSDNGGSFMGPGWFAEFIVENNYFGSKLKMPSKYIEWMDDTAHPAKVFYSGNNKTEITFWGKSSAPKPWFPFYTYSPEPYAGLPTSIPAGAGPKLAFSK